MSSLLYYLHSPLGLLTILAEIALCVHVVRSGQNYYWIFLILIFQPLGAVIYFVAIVLPEFSGGTKARALNRGVKKVLNPNRELNDARRALDIAPTVANRIRLSHLLIAREAWDDVIAVLKPALTDFFAGDPAILEGLATAYYAKKDYAQAFTYIEQIMENKDWPVKPQIELLRARILEMQNQPGPAGEVYTRLAKTSSGEEAKVAYGQYLVRHGRAAEAKPVFEDVVKRSKYMSPHARKMEDEWIRTAQKELNKI